MIDICQDLEGRPIAQQIEILWISGPTYHDPRRIARMLGIEESAVWEAVEGMKEGASTATVDTTEGGNTVPDSATTIAVPADEAPVPVGVQVEVTPDPKDKPKRSRKPANDATPPPTPAAAPAVDGAKISKALLTALRALLPKGKLETTEKAAYTRLNVKGTKGAMGYVTITKKGVTVEIPDGNGSYTRVKVTDDAKEIAAAAKAIHTYIVSKTEAAPAAA